MNMKAIQYHAPGDVRIEDIPVPQHKEDEVLLKIEACAVCGSDLKSFHVGNPRLRPPIVMGHEFSGVVVETGKEVNNIELNERIVMATSISCGECLYCRKGWTNLCVNLAPMGFHFNGGMAEYMAMETLTQAIMINPAIEPSKSLMHSIGNCRNYVTDEIYAWTQENCDAFRPLENELEEFSKFNVIPRTLFVDLGYDLLDAQSTVSKYEGITSLNIYKGGSHRFDHMTEALPAIKNALITFAVY